MMKKLTAILLMIFSALALAACGANTAESRSADDGSDGKRLKIVASIFPEYDWTKAILGDNPANAELTLLLDNGIDLHSFQPSAEDILKISECDVFVYVGGESDEWVEDSLKEAVNKDMKVINLMECLGNAAKTEELKEGMVEEEHEEADDEEEYDEHVWLSVRNAKIFSSDIADVLCEVDPQNAEVYKSNLDKYVKELDSLDEDFTELAENAANKTLIFGDRFPFRYFTDDYGFDYYAAFAGCSAETEASFETIAFLSGKVDELGIKTVFTIDGSDGKIARAVIDNSSDRSAGTAVLDSMQSVNSGSGATYISVMRENYDVLKDALLH